ncbi:MAG TPA: hypothetical protein VGI97_05120 [Gemmatimonadaceae bacterium]
MSDREWLSTSTGRASAALLAVSSGVALWSLVHAVRIAPIPELPAAQIAGGGVLSAPPVPRGIDVAAAVETDPFAADRTAPERAYRPPGEDDGDAAPSAPAAEPVVLGTAVSDPARSFATVQLGDSHAVIMREGGRIGQYTVKSIERGHVVFTTPSGKKLDIPELKP